MPAGDLGPAVSNTSPILALYRIGRAEILPATFEAIWIPAAVQQEIDRFAARDPSLSGIMRAPWMAIRPMGQSALALSLESTLHAGEAEAIALAVETRPSWILIDEQEARSAARKMGLRVTGTLGVLLRAKRRGWIPRLAPEISRLRTIGRFWLSDRVVREALKAAGEELST